MRAIAFEGIGCPPTVSPPLPSSRGAPAALLPGSGPPRAASAATALRSPAAARCLRRCRARALPVVQAAGASAARASLSPAEAAGASPRGEGSPSCSAGRGSARPAAGPAGSVLRSAAGAAAWLISPSSRSVSVYSSNCIVCAPAPSPAAAAAAAPRAPELTRAYGSSLPELMGSPQLNIFQLSKMGTTL